MQTRPPAYTVRPPGLGGGCFVLAGIAALAACAAADEPSARVLRTAAEIAEESTAADAAPARIVFEGPVSYQDPTRSIFVADATGVTFVFGGISPIVQPGDIVRVEGLAKHGVIIGGIKPERVTVIGHGSAPEATPIEPADLGTGRFHYRRVTIDGVVRRVAPAGDSAVRLLLFAAGGQAILELEAPDIEAAAGAQRLVDARVRAIGLVVGNVNKQRQVVEPFVRVKLLGDIEVLAPPPATPFDAPSVPLDKLASRSLGEHRVVVRGTAVAPPLDGAVYLRDGNASLRVRTDMRAISPGDVVEAAGFPEMGVYSIELAEAECRVTGSGEPPPPRPAPAKKRSDLDRLDADLVWIEGPVLGAVDGRVVVRHGDVDYAVETPKGERLEAATGSLVRATGIGRVAAVEGKSYHAFPRSYTLQLPTVGDFIVVHAPSWWTPRRILLAVAAALGATLAVAAVAIVWAMLLRRQVRRQIGVIEEQLQAEAVAEERRRIAREFHDSLNQGLAAAALRLDAAANRLTDERSRRVIEQQRRLLTTLQSEAREFLWDLRDPVHAEASLTESIEADLAQLEPLSSVTLQFEQADAESQYAAEIGPAVLRYEPMIQHQVLRIVREAVANAIAHAKATRITIRVAGMTAARTADGDSAAGSARIEIVDDGCGFDVATRSTAEGHFGIRGMEERARRIGGRIEIRAASGAGTRVILMLPAPLADSVASRF
jgi:signal transduction histidine kinase